MEVYHRDFCLREIDSSESCWSHYPLYNLPLRIQYKVAPKFRSRVKQWILNRYGDSWINLNLIWYPTWREAFPEAHHSHTKPWDNYKILNSYDCILPNKSLNIVVNLKLAGLDSIFILICKKRCERFRWRLVLVLNWKVFLFRLLLLGAAMADVARISYQRKAHNSQLDDALDKIGHFQYPPLKQAFRSFPLDTFNKI
jgi:hypothetical protein